jgi:hypothetical protein
MPCRCHSQLTAPLRPQIVFDPYDVKEMFTGDFLGICKNCKGYGVAMLG